MAYPYATAARVRRRNSRITTDLIADAAINTMTEEDVDKAIIDPELSGCGAPFTTVPASVQLVSAMLTNSMIHMQYLAHTNEESAYAKAEWDRAMELLGKIKAGEYSEDGLTATPLLVMSDPEADRPETEVFTGDETTWEQRTETRE